MTNPRPTPRALARNFTICPECGGHLSPGHVCPPKAATVPPVEPLAAKALMRLETWAAYILRDRQKQEATA
jgi:hypothetical protein